jgi:hypothetical protein
VVVPLKKDLLVSKNPAAYLSKDSRQETMALIITGRREVLRAAAWAWSVAGLHQRSFHVPVWPTAQQDCHSVLERLPGSTAPRPSKETRP